MYVLPIAKSTVKKLPKLRSKLVALPKREPSPSSDKPATVTRVEKQNEQDEPELQVEPVSSTGSTSQTGDASKKVDDVFHESEVCERAVTEISKIIGEIASFYGSGGENYPSDSNDGKTGSSSQSGLVISSSPPVISSEQTTVPSLPSYAPEKCLEAESNYQVPQDDVKSDEVQPISDAKELPEDSSGQCLNVK